jgi:DNA-binding NarL/FixJ family response regulator
VWFSTYQEGLRPRLAAIIANFTEETVQGDQAPVPANSAEPAALTVREVEVLRLLVQGLTNKEIASRMRISESATKNSLQQLFGKTNVRSRGQLVRLGIERYRHVL